MYICAINTILLTELSLYSVLYCSLCNSQCTYHGTPHCIFTVPRMVPVTIKLSITLLHLHGTFHCVLLVSITVPFSVPLYGP